MLLLKPGVSVAGFSPELVLACGVVERVYGDAGYDAVLTSGGDGQHMVGSRHYRRWDGSPGCDAADFRTKHVAEPAVLLRIVRSIAEALGADYDVLYEYAGTPRAHLHIEYDPKATPRPVPGVT